MFAVGGFDEAPLTSFFAPASAAVVGLVAGVTMTAGEEALLTRFSAEGVAVGKLGVVMFAGVTAAKVEMEGTVAVAARSVGFSVAGSVEFRRVRSPSPDTLSKFL